MAFRSGSVVGAGLLVLLVPALSSATILSSTFASRVERAGAIFAGTVSGLMAESLEGTIVTRVHFLDVRYAKGAPLDGEVTRLTLAGGTIGDRSVIRAESVQFEAGRRYIVLSTKDMGSRQNSWSPVIGLWGGLFQVEFDAIRKENVVSTYRGHPIAAVSNGVLELTGTSLVEKNYGKHMTEEEFLSALREMGGLK